MREPFFVAGRWCGKVDVDFCQWPLVGELQIWKGDDDTLLSISPGNRPPEGCRGQYETTGCRGLFSYKSPLFCKLRISLQNSPAKAPDDKGVSSSAELDQQALPAGHPLPFEKEAKQYPHKPGAAR